MAEQLSDSLYQRIVVPCEEGDAYQANNQFDQAIESYRQAFDLVPEPKYIWKASTWILTALGETYLFKQDYISARDTLEEVMYYPDAIGNPFIHLRLGQAQFELGNLVRAADELIWGQGRKSLRMRTPNSSPFFKIISRYKRCKSPNF
jgi:tetratricopeptide (TPR) repeat protein